MKSFILNIRRSLIIIITLIVGFCCFQVSSQDVVKRQQPEPKPAPTPTPNPQPKPKTQAPSLPTAQPSYPQYYVSDRSFVNLGLSKLWGYANYGSSYPMDSGEAESGKFIPETAWSVPSYEDFKELIEKCKWKWSVYEGRTGYEVTGPNGCSIFLPATSSYDGKYTEARYLSQTPQPDGKGLYVLFFNKDSHIIKTINFPLNGVFRPVVTTGVRDALEKAQAGDTKAMAFLALEFHQQGKNKLASEYVNKAMEKNDIKAALRIGQLYLKSNNIDSMLMAYKWMSIPLSKPQFQYKEPTSIVKHINHLTKDEWNQYTDLMNRIGVYYDTHKDFTKAFDWFKRAAALGNADAMNSCGLYYSNGTVVNKDYKLGFEYFMKAAKLDNASGAFNVGLDYFNGLGVEPNIYEAYKWIKKAADSRNRKAMDFLYANFKLSQIKIADGKGEDDGLIGATFIQLRNGKKIFSTATDIDGNVTLFSVEKGDIFKISYVGYKTTYISIDTWNFPKNHTFIIKKGKGEDFKDFR